MPFSEERVSGPHSEMEAKKIFTDAGREWKTRSERYKPETLKNTIFEEVSGQWWVAKNEKGIPVASQGIGTFEDVYLLLGLHSVEKGYGAAMANYVVDKHGDKPKLGAASSSGGKHIFPNKVGFKKLKFKDGFLVGNEDLPTEVKSALEKALQANSLPIRKIYWQDSSQWFVLLKIMQPPERKNPFSMYEGSEGHAPKADQKQQQKISYAKNEKCDYCNNVPVLDCRKCGQKLCRKHLIKPCR